MQTYWDTTWNFLPHVVWIQVWRILKLQLTRSKWYLLHEIYIYQWRCCNITIKAQRTTSKWLSVPTYGRQSTLGHLKGWHVAFVILITTTHMYFLPLHNLPLVLSNNPVLVDDDGNIPSMFQEENHVDLIMLYALIACFVMYLQVFSCPHIYCVHVALVHFEISTLMFFKP